jgi:hypothetical protein
MRRLEAEHIAIAVLDTGDMRVVETAADARQAVMDGFTIYSPKDAYYYVQLEPHERRLLHSFKKQFGGVVEWKDKEGNRT